MSYQRSVPRFQGQLSPSEKKMFILIREMHLRLDNSKIVYDPIRNLLLNKNQMFT